MCGLKETVYKPNAKKHKVYKELYKLYKQLHDAFGLQNWTGPLANVMKELLEIKEMANR